MASTLFADPPMSTMEEARDHFMAAERLKPEGWKENRQFLAKTCARLQDFERTLHWLDRAFELPVKNPDVSCPRSNLDFLYLRLKLFAGSAGARRRCANVGPVRAF
jgi:hypothetical protein